MFTLKVTLQRRLYLGQLIRPGTVQQQTEKHWNKKRRIQKNKSRQKVDPFADNESAQKVRKFPSYHNLSVSTHTLRNLKSVASIIVHYPIQHNSGSSVDKCMFCPLYLPFLETTLPTWLSCFGVLDAFFSLFSPLVSIDFCSV